MQLTPDDVSLIYRLVGSIAFANPNTRHAVDFKNYNFSRSVLWSYGISGEPCSKPLPAFLPSALGASCDLMTSCFCPSAPTCHQVRCVARPAIESPVSDDQILRLLYELDLEEVVNHAGGLDHEQNWERVLSLSEQQLLALANVFLAAPRFVLLDRIEMTLGSEQLKKILQMLSERSIASINFGNAEGEPNLYQAVLEYGEDGLWTWTASPAVNRDH